ncbi:hypothetical protein MYX84_03180, partial [Acidobacteria bacterium AH-259-O06]|nr:hypothetical protein [Acidobacteria bacterium AH-259-O06]
DEATWLRHANPWSVWTRASVLPLVILAVWSREWLGWWSLGPVGASILWMWLNPRIFRRPQSTDNWASRGVLGERVWLNRDRIPIPPHHRIVPNILSGVAGIGALLVIWGVVDLDIWPTLLGSVLIYCGKLWFLDRMVWLYQDMMSNNEEYRAWLY